MSFDSLKQRTVDYGEGRNVTYRITPDGTAYHVNTEERIVNVLQDAYHSDERLIIHYGDAKTGQAWGDVEVGKISRSTGDIKVPLIIPNRRSTGGPAILDNCIVKIETSVGKVPLYTHPHFKNAA